MVAQFYCMALELAKKVSLSIGDARFQGIFLRANRFGRAPQFFLLSIF